MIHGQLLPFHLAPGGDSLLERECRPSACSLRSHDFLT
uniref:Uncharacterized protein n=1 Tax=Utricularia reniformis TaxID=192314 RepID=A0A1Y0B1L9_9LAMI|nr:hypothetical protein AEK19_MT1130 [Utricularia reniformis]ART31346.1 hypothetical protein AEK19_MT1130 [Utricularia reniformis]